MMKEVLKSSFESGSFEIVCNRDSFSNCIPHRFLIQNISSILRRNKMGSAMSLNPLDEQLKRTLQQESQQMYDIVRTDDKEQFCMFLSRCRTSQVDEATYECYRHRAERCVNVLKERNLVNRELSFASIMISAGENNVDSIHFAVKHGVSLNVPPTNYQCVLSYAIHVKSSISTVKCLLQCGASIYGASIYEWQQRFPTPIVECIDALYTYGKKNYFLLLQHWEILVHAIPLLHFDLPLYVMLSILDWLPFQHDPNTMAASRKVELIHNVRNSSEKIKGVNRQ